MSTLFLELFLKNKFYLRIKSKVENFRVSNISFYILFVFQNNIIIEKMIDKKQKFNYHLKNAYNNSLWYFPTFSLCLFIYMVQIKQMHISVFPTHSGNKLSQQLFSCNWLHPNATIIFQISSYFFQKFLAFVCINNL